MRKNLADRYMYGLGGTSTFMPGTAANAFYVKTPGNIAAIKGLLKTQIAQQQQQAEAREREHPLIAASIEDLNRSLEQQSKDYVDAADRGTEAIVSAIETLEGSLVYELREARWMLGQISGQIEVLEHLAIECLTVKAQGYLRQAIKHLSGGFYSEAKDRLHRALESDSTLYQAHRNLAYICLHEGDGLTAQEYFEKALHNAPDDPLRVESLRDLAGFFYLQGNYPKAIVLLDEAMQIVDAEHLSPELNARILYNMALCSARTELEDICVEQLGQAIRLNEAYFALAAVDSGLDVVRERIDDFLERVAVRERDAVADSLVELNEGLSELRHGRHDVLSEAVDQLIKIVERTRERTSDGSYCAIQQGARTLHYVRNCVAHAREFRRLSEELAEVRTALKSAKVRLSEIRQSESIKREKHDRTISRQADRISSRFGSLKALLGVPLAAVIVLIVFSSWKGCFVHAIAHGSSWLPLPWGILNVALIPIGIAVLASIPAMLKGLDGPRDKRILRARTPLGLSSEIVPLRQVVERSGLRVESLAEDAEHEQELARAAFDAARRRCCGDTAGSEARERPPALSDVDWTHLRELIRTGKKFAAVALIRKSTEWGLKEAKDFVDSF